MPVSRAAVSQGLKLKAQAALLSRRRSRMGKGTEGVLKGRRINKYEK